MIQFVKKRDGRVVPFDPAKISAAIANALKETGEAPTSLSEKLSEKVISTLEARYAGLFGPPGVEEIQDIVEEVLMKEGLFRTARAYILYRYQHKQMRELRDLVTPEAVEDYLSEADWRVKENANMSFSLQGLNVFLTEKIISRYWLSRVYPPHIRKAHENGDFHIHDLGTLGPYCVGWDIRDLLLHGFGGVRGKIHSKPPKHFRTALLQAANFLYTLQGEAAGAQAFSSLDTYLAPFIAYDELTYPQVKQAIQEFVFNLNVPTRVGFQCLSEDTKILTPKGWKGYDEVREGDVIYTFNLKTHEIEPKPVTYVFRRYYEGPMYNLRNRSQDQLISPGHRVVRKEFNSNGYRLEPIEELLDFSSPIPIPTVGENVQEDLHIPDEQLKLLAWVLAEGSVEKGGSHRVSLYQSEEANPENYAEIEELLQTVGAAYGVRSQRSWGNCKHVRLDAASSRLIHSWLGGTEKRFPEYLFRLSKRQARLFIDTYIKGDGWRERTRRRIVTTDREIALALAGIAVLAGYNVKVRERRPMGPHSKRIQFVLTLTESGHDYIQEIRKLPYRGVIWSVHTENETVIAMRNGQVFITGNTPFTNVTLDIRVPRFMEREPVIIGGKPQRSTYGEFAREMSWFNRAFAEVMAEGDATGRPFTFPIPTYNITPDFPWADPDLEPIWEMTAKYGIPYFANFVNSDMRPEDVRSMCCHLRLNNEELRKRGGGLFGANPLTGSIGVVTINLPRIGYLARNEGEFLERLEELMELAKQSLVIKRKLLERLTEAGLYPYSRFWLRGVKQATGEYWKNHFSTIGIIGMNEACLNLFGKDLSDPECIAFAERILDFMNEKLVRFQDETDHLWNLEATPAEGTSHRLARIDKEKFPRIIVANEDEVRNGAAPYYTNSTHLPVEYSEDLYRVLVLQDPLQVKYTGGTVLHIWLGERAPSGEAVKALVRQIVWNFRLPYFTITPTFSVCPSHGYLEGERERCPSCGSPAEVYSRVVGYLRPVEQWNPGKRAEFSRRVTFSVGKVHT